MDAFDVPKLRTLLRVATGCELFCWGGSEVLAAATVEITVRFFLIGWFPNVASGKGVSVKAEGATTIVVAELATSVTAMLSRVGWR